MFRLSLRDKGESFGYTSGLTSQMEVSPVECVEKCPAQKSSDWLTRYLVAGLPLPMVRLRF